MEQPKYRANFPAFSTVMVRYRRRATSLTYASHSRRETSLSARSRRRPPRPSVIASEVAAALGGDGGAVRRTPGWPGCWPPGLSPSGIFQLVLRRRPARPRRRRR